VGGRVQGKWGKGQMDGQYDFMSDLVTVNLEGGELELVICTLEMTSPVWESNRDWLGGGRGHITVAVP